MHITLNTISRQDFLYLFFHLPLCTQNCFSILQRTPRLQAFSSVLTSQFFIVLRWWVLFYSVDYVVSLQSDPFHNFVNVVCPSRANTFIYLQPEVMQVLLLHLAFTRLKSPECSIFETTKQISNCLKQYFILLGTRQTSNKLSHP